MLVLSSKMVESDLDEGVALFEYDPNTDWRLWYEEVSEMGRRIWQDNIVPQAI